jgi:hypothetical protein
MRVSGPASRTGRRCIAAAATPPPAQPPSPHTQRHPRPTQPAPTPLGSPGTHKPATKLGHGGGGARSAAAARLRRTQVAPPPAPSGGQHARLVEEDAAATLPTIPAGTPANDIDDDDDFPIEPAVLPVDPAAVAPAREAAAAGEGLAVIFFRGDPAVAEAGGGGAAATVLGPSRDDPLTSGMPPPPRAGDPDAALRGLTPAEVDDRTDLLMRLMLAGTDFEATLARHAHALDEAALRLLEKRIDALKLCGVCGGVGVMGGSVGRGVVVGLRRMVRG